MAFHDDIPRGHVRLSRTRGIEEWGISWIYAGYVEEVSGGLASGDVVDVWHRMDDFMPEVSTILRPRFACES